MNLFPIQTGGAPRVGGLTAFPKAELRRSSQNNVPYKKLKDLNFICTTLSSVHGRDRETGEWLPIRYQITAYWLTPKEWLKEKAFHFLICRGIERILPRRITNWYVPAKWLGVQPEGMPDFKAPLDVWSDLRCPANTGAFRHGKTLGHIDITKEQYVMLSNYTEPKGEADVQDTQPPQAEAEAAPADRAQGPGEGGVGQGG